jgi:hypothetical protein
MAPGRGRVPGDRTPLGGEDIPMLRVTARKRPVPPPPPPPPAPGLLSVAVLPANGSLEAGTDQQYTAVGTYDDGSTRQIVGALAWTAAGGTITSAGVFTAGAVGGGTIGVTVGTVQGSTPVTIVPAPPPAPALVSLLVLPANVSVQTRLTQQYTATGIYSDQSTANLTNSVAWTVTRGAISPTGLFTAGLVGAATVVAKLAGITGTAPVDVIATPPAPPPPTPGGPYDTLAAQDWSLYANKAALAGLFGCEGNRQNEAPAISPVDLLWDLIPDPIFGKVVRYNGELAFNSSVAGGARIATHGVGLGLKNIQPNASWVPKLESSGDTYYRPTHVWVRQFIRYDPHWITFDHKAMFLRYRDGGRHEFKIGTGGRQIAHVLNNPAAGTLVGEGHLPISNVQTINAQYGVTGYPFFDAFPIIKVSHNPPPAPYGNGNGEWVEVIILHELVAGTFRRVGVAYWRQYTVGGVVNPQPWKIDALYRDFSATGSGVNRYEMGVNRNDKWPAAMNVYWGPYEVVDGSVFPNPFGVPLP